MKERTDFLVPCSKNYPRCLHSPVSGFADAVPALECGCFVSQRSTEDSEPIFAVRLLPEVREAVEAYAREQGISTTVAIAEACRAYVGRAE